MVTEVGGYCLVRNAKIVIVGTENECEAYGRGYNDDAWAVIPVDDFEYYKNLARGGSSKRRNPIMRNIADNTISHASDEYMKRPLNYNRQRRRRRMTEL